MRRHIHHLHKKQPILFPFFLAALFVGICLYIAINLVPKNQQHLKHFPNIEVYKEIPANENQITTITRDIVNQFRATKTFDSNLLEKIVLRKHYMYYLAREDPTLFLQNVLPDDLLADPGFALLAEQKVTLISEFSLDEQSHSYIIHFHMMNVPLHVYNTHSEYINSLNNRNVEVKGYKLEDRIVLPTTNDLSIRQVSGKYGGH